MTDQMENTADIFHSKMMALLLDCLPKISVFKDLTADDLKDVAKFMFFLDYKEGDTIFNEGDKGDFVCFVIAGGLEVTKAAADGCQTPITTLTAGDAIGEMAVIDDHPRSATVKATAPTKVVTLSHGNFDNLLERHPRIASLILRQIARNLSINLRRTSNQLADSNHVH